MNNYTEQLQQELAGSSAITAAMFEIRVRQEGESAWIDCDVIFKGDRLIAQRCAVSAEEESSKYMAHTSIPVEYPLGLDEHLEWLLERVESDIEAGDLYTLV